MVIDTEGLVLRQVKTAGGRRMLLLFSKRFGKISVGASLTEGGKNKSALAIRPFTLGRYALFKGRESYNLNHAQVIRSFYGLGEDLDKYMAASYVLELTEKLLPEELAQPRLYQLLLDFMDCLAVRKRDCGTLVMAYMVKALDVLGSMPYLDGCVCCGATEANRFFSISEGGMVCAACAKNQRESENRALIYDTNFGIIEILKYFQQHPLSAFAKLTLEQKTLGRLQTIIRSYLAYHFDVQQLKSETFFRDTIL